MNGNKLTMTVLAALAAAAANAKTVALWTMDPTEQNGVKLLRCAISPRNDLVLFKHLTITTPDQTIGWNLPPNPDTSPDLVRSAVSRKCVNISGISREGNIISSTEPTLAQAVAPSHDFTIEGWLNIAEFPNNTTRLLLFAGLSGNGSYMLQFAPNSGDATKRDVQIAWRKSNGPSEIETICSSVSNEQLTNAWHHYAFVFTREKANGKSEWAFYLDGTEKGTYEHEPKSNIAVDARFVIGGTQTGNANGNNTAGSFDYWRISDEALSPSEFLCAGGAGTIVPEKKTLAYWKFGRNPDGSVDARDYIGTADFSQGFYTYNTNYLQNAAVGILSVRPSVESHDGNGAVKCLAIDDGGAVLQHPTLGTNLTFDREFSVEGWVKPMWRGTESAQTYLCGTLDNYSGKWRGWIFIMKQDENGYRFLVGAQDGSGTDSTAERGNLTMGESGFNNAAVMSPYYAFDEQWVKLRLSYVPTSVGENLWNGTWTLYVNDEMAGTAIHAKAFDASSSPTDGTFPCFYLGGTSRGGWFHGLLDDWRVSVAGSEVAHWPLDVANGVDMDLTDTHGAYSFAPDRNITVTANADGPTVTNPDTTAMFDGIPSVNSGSARIAAEQNIKGYLAVNDPDLFDAIANATDWTIEGWVMLNQPIPSVNKGALIFALSDRIVPQGMGELPFYIAINPSYQIGPVDNRYLNNAKQVICRNETDWQFPQNTWTHFAVVRSCSVSGATTNGLFRLYVNGTLMKTSEEYQIKKPKITQMLVGGDPKYDVAGGTAELRNLPGSVSSFRISLGALGPDEFLCAQSPAPAADSTLAYWPLNNNNGSVDGTVSVGKGGYEMCLGGDGASGSTAMARRMVNAAGLPSANTGSVSVASAPLSADYIGALVSPSAKESWSVEGYFKNDEGGTVCRMGEAGCGWQLDYEPGENRFSLVAESGALCCPSVSGTFSAAAVATGKWNHVLLTYDASVALPVWRLYVNGQAAGSVASVWSGASSAYGEKFSIVSGGYDLWRVSRGVTEVSDSLYSILPGFLLMYR